jgi:hypothetical protein
MAVELVVRGRLSWSLGSISQQDEAGCGGWRHRKQSCPVGSLGNVHLAPVGLMQRCVIMPLRQAVNPC